jgi:Ca-activated chloride channel family protein
MVNYFDYNYPEPVGDEPFSYSMEMAASPWTTGRDLVMIKIKGREIDSSHNTNKNLVLLVDVSGSMSDTDKLPLIKTSFKKLVTGLTANDKVAIVSYAATAKVVLASTSGDQKTTINAAIDSLVASGSTDVGNGLQLAYDEANLGFIESGINRVILATDGDFNTGLTSQKSMLQFIASQRQNNEIFMTVLGYGITDYDDNIMQIIADNGDGNYYYVDNEKESYRIFVQNLQSTLFTIAKDLKIQVEFNPNVVERYRLIGYETRVMEDSGFSDDSKDGGEIGAGHSVTAFYEIEKVPVTPPPAYILADTSFEDNEALELRIRYKKPDEDFSRYLSKKLINENSDPMSQDMGFAASVVEYAMILRDSAYKENSSYSDVITRATTYKGLDDWELRQEFIDIVTETIKVDK